MVGLGFERPAAVVMFAWSCAASRERQAPGLVVKRAAETEAGCQSAATRPQAGREAATYACGPCSQRSRLVPVSCNHASRHDQTTAAKATARLTEREAGRLTLGTTGFGEHRGANRRAEPPQECRRCVRWRLGCGTRNLWDMGRPRQKRWFRRRSWQVQRLSSVRVTRPAPR